MNEKNVSKGANGQYTTNGKPNYYSTITPFIVVSQPSEAMRFYETVFGAVTKDATVFTNDKGEPMVVHAEMDFGSGCLQLGSANPMYQLTLPPEGDAVCYSLAIYVTDVDAVVKTATENGAVLREAVNDFVSGDRFGSILDPFGVRWTVMTRTEDLSDEESRERVKQWAAQFSKTL